MMRSPNVEAKVIIDCCAGLVILAGKSGLLQDFLLAVA
jgi:hypothetical protein